MNKGIIFDLDGTVLDTIEDLRQAVNYTIVQYNYKELDKDKVLSYVGNGFRKLIERSMPNSDEKTIDEALEIFINKYELCFNDKTCPYVGIRETLNILKSSGVKLAINSNKGDKFTKELINTHFKDIEFVEVIGSRNGVPNKPDPYSANEIVMKMGLDKKDVFYIGDSETDIKTGKNAGLVSVAVTWGFRGRETLEKCQPDIIIDEPKSILNIIK